MYALGGPRQWLKEHVKAGKVDVGVWPFVLMISKRSPRRRVETGVFTNIVHLINQHV